MALLAAIVAAQVGLVAWWLVIPLPNAHNLDARRTVTRGKIVLTAFPQVVPDVTLAASGVGRMAEGLAHPENLPQRIPMVLAASLILAGGMGLGEVGLRALRLRSSLSPGERIPAAFGLGMLALALLTLGLGRLGALNPWIVRVGLAGAGAAWLALARPISLGAAFGKSGAGLGLLLAVAPFVVFMAMAALLPTQDYDAVEYHLQAPKEYYLAGRIAFLPHSVYASMPFGVEMLHLLGMIVMGDWWRGAIAGQFVVMLHAPMAAAMVGLAASRLASPRAGRFAAFAYLTAPWIYRMGGSPYVEGPMLFYHAAALWAVVSRRWGMAGLMAGAAMGCKYPALVSAVVPFGLAALASRSPRAVGAFALGVIVAVGPWLAKNVADTGNPVYPLAWKVFGGSPWNAAREAKWQAAHGPRPHSWPALRDGILDVAGRSDWQSVAFAVLGPFAFLRKGSRRSSVVLALYAAYVFATWYSLTHRLDRFWLPVLPPLAILAGQGADWSRSRVWSIWLGVVLGVITFTNLMYATTPLTTMNDWTKDLATLRRTLPHDLNDALATMDEALPPDARPLLVGQAAVFHLRHPVVYNTVFDDEILETIAKGRSPDEVRRAMRERGITYVYVDWPEVARHRKPGGYGFTDWVRPEVFAELVRAKVLVPMPPTGFDRDLYRVAP